MLRECRAGRGAPLCRLQIYLQRPVQAPCSCIYIEYIWSLAQGRHAAHRACHAGRGAPLCRLYPRSTSNNQPITSRSTIAYLSRREGMQQRRTPYQHPHPYVYLQDQCQPAQCLSRSEKVTLLMGSRVQGSPLLLILQAWSGGPRAKWLAVIVLLQT